MRSRSNFVFGPFAKSARIKPKNVAHHAPFVTRHVLDIMGACPGRGRHAQSARHHGRVPLPRVLPLSRSCSSITARPSGPRLLSRLPSTPLALYLRSLLLTARLPWLAAQQAPRPATSGPCRWLRQAGRRGPSPWPLKPLPSRPNPSPADPAAAAAGEAAAAVAGSRGQAASGLRGASCGHLQVRTNLLVLPHHSPATAGPSPAVTGQFPDVLCFNLAWRTSGSNSSKGEGLNA